MDCSSIREGIKVRITKLDGIEGMAVASKYLYCRSVGVTGTVLGYVPGHGGDVWFVSHDGSDDVGAYCFTELEFEHTKPIGPANQIFSWR